MGSHNLIVETQNSGWTSVNGLLNCGSSWICCRSRIVLLWRLSFCSCHACHPVQADVALRISLLFPSDHDDSSQRFPGFLCRVMVVSITSTNGLFPGGRLCAQIGSEGEDSGWLRFLSILLVLLRPSTEEAGSRFGSM